MSECSEFAALQKRLRKPEPIKRTKGRAGRLEAAVTRSVRAACVMRDGHCRIGEWEMNPLDWHSEDVQGDECDWWSEWAHLGEKRRARTRGQAPTVRHTTAGSLPLVTWKGKSLRTLRCNGTSGKGPHSQNVTEGQLWALIDLRHWRCAFHPADMREAVS